MRALPSAGMDVLFVAYGGGHVTMLHPVEKAVSEAGFATGFLGLTTAQAYLDRHGANYFGFADLAGADDPQVQTWGRALAGPEVEGATVPYRESVAYHGLNFRDLVLEMGETAAHRHYERHGRQGFFPVNTMQWMLETLRPRLVVATNSPRSERALFRAAQNLGIPALCVVDLFAIQEVKWIAEPNYADVICVLNDQVRSFFVKQGCIPEAVIVTGNPAFDALTSFEKVTEGRILRERRGFGAGENVILWASNVEPVEHPFTGAPGNPELPRQIEAELRRLVTLHDDWRLVVRYHPSEAVPFEQAPHVSLSGRDEDLHALVHAVDAVVVMASTVGLEAYLAGRPVVSVDMSVFTADAPYEEMGVSTGIQALHELEGAITKAVSGERGDAREQSVTTTATQAVSNQILSLLGQAN